MTEQSEFEESLQIVLSLLDKASNGERAIETLLVLILTEVRASKKATVALQAQFDQVSSGGNALATERMP